MSTSTKVHEVDDTARENGIDDLNHTDAQEDAEVAQSLELLDVEDHEGERNNQTNGENVVGDSVPPRRYSTRSAAGKTSGKANSRAAPPSETVAAPTTNGTDGVGTKRTLEEANLGNDEPPRPAPVPPNAFFTESASAPLNTDFPPIGQPGIDYPPSLSAQLPGQYTFLAASPSTAVFERRGPRTRTAQPVPVPNLTKKSRGRRVPTDLSHLPPRDPGTKVARVYQCKVEECGKCFSRGEHLKRHVRSIHTHEKPFQCQFPSCDKFFNRHDNLLQHQKVHKGQMPVPSADPAIAQQQAAAAAAFQQSLDQRAAAAAAASQQTNGSSSREPEQQQQQQQQQSQQQQPAAANYFASLMPGYHSGPLPPGVWTNMNVSSLRTELPAPHGSNGYTGFEHEHPQGNDASVTADQQPTAAGPPPASDAFVTYNQ